MQLTGIIRSQYNSCCEMKCGALIDDNGDGQFIVSRKRP